LQCAFKKQKAAQKTLLKTCHHARHDPNLSKNLVSNRHSIGTPTSSDAEVYAEPDEAFYVGVGRDFGEKMLYISSGAAARARAR
jgi:protease II